MLYVIELVLYTAKLIFHMAHQVLVIVIVKSLVSWE